MASVETDSSMGSVPQSALLRVQKDMFEVSGNGGSHCLCNMAEVDAI